MKIDVTTNWTIIADDYPEVSLKYSVRENEFHIEDDCGNCVTLPLDASSELAAAPSVVSSGSQRMSTLYPSDKIILKHLTKRKSISPMEALASYGCARLAPRIFNLRKAGYPITTKINRDEPGHRYARYHLATKSNS